VGLDIPPDQRSGVTGEPPAAPGNLKNAEYSTKSVDIVSACCQALPRILRVFSANCRKCLSMNNLHLISCFASQGQSNPIKVNQGKKSPVWVRQCGAELRNLYQNSRD
jgi:hypothetical protein